MNLIYNSLKIIHIASGSLALITGILAILLRNHTKRHRPVGKIYFWSMTVIFITALFMSLYKFNLFLFFIDIFTFHSAFIAFRSLKLKKLHQGQKPALKDWTAEGLNALTNACLFAFGVYYLFTGRSDFGIISMVFGSIGLRNSWISSRRLSGKIKHQNYWLLVHIGGMLGSYIGALTAFLVNNNQKLGIPDLAAWLGPTVVLVPFIIYEVSLRKKSITGHD